jgi:hypothetical protein
MADDIIQVRVGKGLIGLRGLPEVFRELASRSGETPEALQEHLLRQVAGQNYIPAASRDEYRRALWREYRRFRGEMPEPESGRGLEIQVLGLGCSGCQAFFQQVVEILAARGVAAELQYVTDPALLKNYRVRAFPALVLNGRLVLAGQLPSSAELEKILLAGIGPVEVAKPPA